MALSHVVFTKVSLWVLMQWLLEMHSSSVSPLCLLNCKRAEALFQNSIPSAWSKQNSKVIVMGGVQEVFLATFCF